MEMVTKAIALVKTQTKHSGHFKYRIYSIGNDVNRNDDYNNNGHGRIRNAFKPCVRFVLL